MATEKQDTMKAAIIRQFGGPEVIEVWKLTELNFFLSVDII